MKNCVLKSVLALSLAGSFALAQGGFVGVEGGYDFSSKLKDNDGLSFKDNRPNLGIKGGYDFDVARVYGGYFYHTEAKDNFNYTDDGVKHDVSIKWTTHKFVVGGDYTPAITDNFKLIAGLYTGISVVNFKARLYTNTLKNFNFWGLMTPYFYLKFLSFFTSNLQWLIYKEYQFNKSFLP